MCVCIVHCIVHYIRMHCIMQCMCTMHITWVRRLCHVP